MSVTLGRGGRDLRGRPAHSITIHRPDRARRQAMHLDTRQDPRQGTRGLDPRRAQRDPPRLPLPDRRLGAVGAGPKRKDMEKFHYSGKAGRHAAKIQYTVNMHGLIIHNIGHSIGRVHDFKVYKTKRLTFPKDLPNRDGSAREGKRANLRTYGDLPKMHQVSEVSPTRESARTCGLMATVGIRECRKWIQTLRWCCQSGASLAKSSPRRRRRSTDCSPRSGSVWEMRSAGSKPTGSWVTDTEIR